MFHESFNFGSGVSPKREIKIGIGARGGAFLPPLAVIFHKNLISDFSCMQEVCSANLILSISLASVSETTDQTLSRMYFSLVLYLKKVCYYVGEMKGEKEVWKIYYTDDVFSCFNVMPMGIVGIVIFYSCIGTFLFERN